MQEELTKEKIKMDINSLRERKATTISVTELNAYVKGIIESSPFLSSVTVKGEISNLTLHRSGHLYFSLKDEESQIRAVMFRSSASKLKFLPESGMKVVVHGAVSVYQRDGSYQLYVSTMQPDGIGALYLAYEQLKSKLEGEGLFRDSHKVALPKFPERIGVITSPSGAAVRDIINVIGRRFPIARIYLYPSLVQGDGTEADLCKGIDYFNRSNLADVVIIGRGGGSIEDLWAFNSEKLARKIFDSDVPIISAVGHETDFTICDFVSDMRAPTPSAAAELSVPDIRELIMSVDSCVDRCTVALEHSLEISSERLSNLKEKLLDKGISKTTDILEDKLVKLSDRLVRLIDRRIEEDEHRLTVVSEKLSALNPLSILKRGYSVISGSDGSIVSIDSTCVGDKIEAVINGGKIKAEVTNIEKDKL